MLDSDDLDREQVIETLELIKKGPGIRNDLPRAVFHWLLEHYPKFMREIQEKKVANYNDVLEHIKLNKEEV